MFTVKRVALIYLLVFVSTTFGSEYDRRGFRTKALRSHRKSGHNFAALTSGGEISYSGGGDGGIGAGITGAGEQGSKFAEAGLTSIKEGGDQVKENVEAAAKAFIDAFLQTFKEGVEDLKLALDDHYSSNGGNVKFNFKHTSENNNNGEWKTNTITCTSGLGSEPIGDTGRDDSFFDSREDAFSARIKPRSKFDSGSTLGLGSSGKGRLSFGGDTETASGSSGKGKFAFAVDGNNSGSTATGSSGKAKLTFGAVENSDFSERRGKVDSDFTSKSHSDENGSQFTGPLGSFGFSVKNPSRGAGSGSYSAGADDESSGGFGISGKSSSDSDSAGVTGFSFGSSSATESEGKSSAKFSLGGIGGTGSSAKFSLGRLRRARPVSRIDYAIEDERPWRDYILKSPESPYTPSYGSQSIAPTYINYPHN
jgi:hypothetical protein